MKKHLRPLLCLTALLVGSTLANAEPASGWRGIFVGGLTKGGDSIFTTVNVEDGGRQHVYAGNLLQVGAGALWTAREWPLAIALSVNYHIDDATGASESAQFSRTPLEAIAYYVNPERDWRAGFGFRYVTGARLEANFPNSTFFKRMSARFKDARGFVAETGWAFGDHVWLNFRAVKELYEINSLVIDGVSYDVSGAEKTNGSHVGVNLLYAF
jgi:hypothetical protein